MKQILWNEELEAYSLLVGIQDHPSLKALRKQNESMLGSVNISNGAI